MSRKIFLSLSLALIALVTFATLSPLGLRPHMGGATVERFGAFGLIGFALGMTFPRRFWLVLGIVIVTALGLELLQLLTPDRHGRLIDAWVKLAGGVAGVCASWLALRLLPLVGGPRLFEQAVAPTRSD